MQFYDLHVHIENIEETVRMAKILGITGLGLIKNWTSLEDLGIFKKQIEQYKNQIDIAVGVEIHGKPQNIVNITKQIRKEVELILVHGGDLEVNRIAVETSEIDILLHPEFKGNQQPGKLPPRQDSGLDQTMVKLAKKNNVLIEFGFNDVIYSYKKTRALVLKGLLRNAKLVKKYKAPFAITSGAWSQWNLRSASDLLSFGRYLGFQGPEIKKAFSAEKIFENRKRLSGKWVMPGVEVMD